MKSDELNTFIKNYMDNDKTGMAVLLTSPWGYGKSYYIQNTLKPYLSEEENKCIVVSLYGLGSVQEISKQIYISLREIRITKGKKQKSEVISTGKAIGKAVARTLLNVFISQGGFDLPGTDEKAMQEIYESIDLTGKLVVLEDLERSEIDIVKILGYVNNLTENDHVKVLLVANEDDIIKKEIHDEEEIYSAKTETYLKYKEKTVGDTIRLSDDQTNAITNILSEYGHLACIFSAEKIISEVGRVNLRTFKYACQKSNELLEYVKNILDQKTTYMKQFEECIFFGILKQAIALSLNFDQACKWTGGKYFIEEDDNQGIRYLGPTHRTNLLFKFCFDFLVNHEIPSKMILSETYEAYSKYCLYKSNQTADDEDLSIIKSFHIQRESCVRQAVMNIAHRLENKEDIPYLEYGVLSKTLIRIHYRLEINIEECKKRLVENLKGKHDDVDADMIFLSDFKEEQSEEYAEYIELKEKMISAIDERENMPVDFDYEPCHFQDLQKCAMQQRNRGEDFISVFDIEKLKNAIKKATALELDHLRGVFFSAYRRETVGDKNVYYKISEKDKSDIFELIKFIKDNDFDDFDKVQKLQLSMLADNLTEMANYGTSKENLEITILS